MFFPTKISDNKVDFQRLKQKFQQSHNKYALKKKTMFNNHYKANTKNQVPFVIVLRKQNN